MILVLDFGSQYTQLIARRIREANVYCEIHPFNFPLDKIDALKPEGIILSGGPASVYQEDAFFANATYLLMPRWDINGGFRYSHNDQRVFTYGVGPGGSQGLAFGERQLSSDPARETARSIPRHLRCQIARAAPKAVWSIDSSGLRQIARNGKSTCRQALDHSLRKAHRHHSLEMG